MTDPQPLVCVFFRLPPSCQTFRRINEIPWLVFLPQLEKLTAALTTLPATNPSSEAKKALLDAREVMATKMRPLRDVMLSGRKISKHYLEFLDEVSQNRMLNVFAKEAFRFMAQEAAKKSEKAQQALSEFREELESVVSRITGLVGADNDNISLFFTESSQIVSVMIAAIEECSALIQECSESFMNIYNQDFDPESFERNPPSDAEFKIVQEKWEMLENFLRGISVD